MRLLHALGHLWRDLVHRDRVERELHDELASWVELSVDERVRAGEDPAVARRAVMAEVRGEDALKDAVRATRRTHVIESLIQDARYAMRSFRHAPAFTVTALLVLTLGIGGTTGVFAVLRATLLSPLKGVRDPGALVAFDRWEGQDRYDSFGYPDLVAYRHGIAALSGITAYTPTPFTGVIGPEGAERLRGALVTGNYFGVLGVSAVAGRVLGLDDDVSGRANVVVISTGLWRRAYGGDPGVVGSSIRLDGRPFTVVGVVSPAFAGVALGEGTDVWGPLAAQPVLLSRMGRDIMESRTAGWLTLVGRLGPGATLEQAAAQARAVAAGLAEAFPGTNGQRTASLRRGVSLDPDDRGALGRMLALTALAAALLLLVACANVAGLIAARSAGRRREMAARVALGASRGRLVRQLLVESAILGGVGGVLALTVGKGVVGVALRLQPAGSLLRLVSVSLDPVVVGFGAMATVVSVALFALSPALRTVAVDPMAVVREGAPGAGGGRRIGMRILVGSQVALSFALLVCAITVTSAIRDLMARSPGFDPRGLVVASVDLTAEGLGASAGAPLYHRLIARLEGDPELSAASFAKTLPPRDWSDRISVFRPGEVPTRQELRDHEMELGFRMQLDRVAPRYFETLRIPLLRGRTFTDADDEGAPGVAIVNESMARAWWPDSDPVGKKISWPTANGPGRPPLEVVGVVADHRYTSLTRSAAPLLYVPVRQAYDGRATLVGRAVHGTDDGARALRRALRDVAPDVAVYGTGTMEERMADSMWASRTLARWLEIFSLLALVMSLVGIYGVVAQAVSRRAREMAIRLALGARPSGVVVSLVGEGALMAGAGLLAGVPVAVVGYLLAVRQLDGMQAGQWTAWGGSALVLAVATLAASLAPARRAVVDPANTLRNT